jgi:hypothetical protein
MFGLFKKPTEDQLDALNTFIEMYIEMLEVQKYLSFKVTKKETDIEEIKAMLYNNFNEAKSGNLAKFKIITDDLQTAKKECDMLVLKLAEIYNGQFEKPFHVSQIKKKFKHFKTI